MISAPVLLSVLTLTLLATLTDCNFIQKLCENTKYGFLKSRDETNLKLVLSSLILNTPKNGFSTATEGQRLNRVYGLAVCRGDTSDDDCTSCLNTASSHLLELCPHPKGGMVWFNNCAVRYSINNNFFSHLPADKYCKGCVGYCTQDGPPNPDQFSKNLLFMLQSLSRIAAFNESARMFATGVNAQTYAMVQCTRDLSDQQCFQCLYDQNLYKFFQGCGSYGSFVKWNCMMQYSTGNFFNSDPIWVAPPDHYRLVVGRSNFSSFVAPNPTAYWKFGLVN